MTVRDILLNHVDNGFSKNLETDIKQLINEEVRKAYSLALHDAINFDVDISPSSDDTDYYTSKYIKHLKI